MLTPANLRCEYLVNPLGVDEPQPRLFWTLDAAGRDQRQSAYHIHVAASEQALAAGTLTWDSGRVASARSTQIVYAGPPLRSGARYWWRVRVWDQDGRPSPYSRAAWWQMGLLDGADWQASWIGFDTGPGGGMGMKPSPFLRREFGLDKPVARATLYVSACGLYQLRLNGARLGEAVLAPDWTDYSRRICYDSYDVTALLQRGTNALAAILGDGWYCGHVGWFGERNHYGEAPELLVQLVIEAEDGSRQLVTTDSSWKGSAGPIVCSDLLMGEHYDARRELHSWDRAGYDDQAWAPVTVAPNYANLVAAGAESVQVAELLPTRAMSETRPGVYIFDLGQNFAGWARLRVRGEAGTKIRLRYGERLNRDGALYTDNLRGARAADTYILRGGGEELWEPHFTYHGFRYVEVEGLAETPGPETITGCAIWSQLRQTGQFACSSPMLNQLWRNILWGQRSNFVSIPTDCPQRDERLGWLGDVLAFGRTASLNMDTAAFFSRWMTSVVDAQSAEGAFPDVAPRLIAVGDGAPAWGDAGLVLPWTLYQLYGDTRVIERHYDAMARWMEYIQAGNPGRLRTHRLNLSYGDWVSYNADTPRELLATAFWAYGARLMAEMARVIGRDVDAEQYGRLFEEIRSAFVEAYVSADGRVRGETQTGYLLALQFDLLPPALREAAVTHLIADIEGRDGHLSTGVVGTSYLLPVLSEVGRLDVAYRILNQESVPSWGYMVACGATTIWERWDSLTPDGEVFDPVHPTFLHPEFGPVAGMNSFNHYAFGGVGEWLYRYLAGIDVDPQQPGYKSIRIRPHPGGDLTHARASYDSIHGPITSAWWLEGGTLRLEVSIPANTSATVAIPGAFLAEMTEGGCPIDRAQGVRTVSDHGGQAVMSIGSGSYVFVAVLSRPH